MTESSIQPWTPGVMTFTGQVFAYDGVCYRAKYSFLTMGQAPPPADPTLWDRINNP